MMMNTPLPAGHNGILEGFRREFYQILKILPANFIIKRKELQKVRKAGCR